MELARLREKPIAQIAADLSISESCLRRSVDLAAIEQGHKEGLTKDERAELVRLRRETRVQTMEIEILKRASAYFARENGYLDDIPPAEFEKTFYATKRTDQPLVEIQ